MEHVDGLLIAVSELVANGIEAGAKVGRLWVKIDASCVADGVLIRVRNQGPPYQRADVSTAHEMPSGDAHRGRGLALVTVLVSMFEIEGQIGGSEARVTSLTSPFMPANPPPKADDPVPTTIDQQIERDQ